MTARNRFAPSALSNYIRKRYQGNIYGQLLINYILISTQPLSQRNLAVQNLLRDARNVEKDGRLVLQGHSQVRSATAQCQCSGTAARAKVYGGEAAKVAHQVCGHEFGGGRGGCCGAR